MTEIDKLQRIAEQRLVDLARDLIVTDVELTEERDQVTTISIDPGTYFSGGTKICQEKGSRTMAYQ